MSDEAAPDKASGFSFKVALAILFVGIFSFSSYMILSTFAPDMATGDDGRAHALSRSAVGYAGVVKLLNESGRRATVSRTVTTESAPSLAVLTPQRPISRHDVMDRSGRATLIVLPKWIVMPSAQHRGWVRVIEALPGEALAPLTRDVLADLEIAHGEGKAPIQLKGGDGETIETGPIGKLQTMSSRGLEPLVTDAAGRVILARVYLVERIDPEEEKERAEEDAAANEQPSHAAPTTGGTPDEFRVLDDESWPPVYILSDPDFLNTQGMADARTARAGLRLLELLRKDASAPIVFDVTLAGFQRDRTPMRLMLTPPFLAATLCLAAAALLLVWRAITLARPQAHEQRVIALGKRVLTENSAALMRLTRRQHQFGVGYARLIGARAAERLGFGRHDANETARLLDRLKLEASPPFTELVAQAAAADDNARLTEAARRLHAWREEAERATR